MNLAAELEGRRVLVTGGGVGIGRAIVEGFARAGCTVAFTYLRHAPTAVDAGRTQVGWSRDPIAARLDATSEADVQAVVDGLAERLGGVDILVNNAGGMVARQDIANMALALWNRVLEVNLTSAFLVTRAAMPHLTDGGRVVNLSSLAARTGGGNGAVAYATTKAALIGFTRGMAKELAPRRITVNAVAPGLILGTPFHDTFTPAADQEAIAASIPLGRPGRPEDVAGAVLWLASDAAGFITGAIVDINGGVHFA